MTSDEVSGELHQQQWLFSAEALARARESAHSAAVQALKSAVAEGLIERRAGSREPIKPIDLEQGCSLVLFYAQQIPELCGLCSAPSEVRWAAIVFFRRFFAVRSPMEFDPVPMMFASVHLACKIEEVHEITLDKLLDAAGFGADPGLRDKVASLELPLLEGLGFALLVEPKPDSALRVLEEDLRQLLRQQQGLCASSGGGPPESPARRSSGQMDVGLLEELQEEALQSAEDIVLHMSVRTDAVLRWPISALLAGALGAALDDAVAQRRGGGSGSTTTAGSETLAALLDASLEAEPQRCALRKMLDEVGSCIRSPACSAVIAQSAMKETAKVARKCHRAFDRLREEATERHEAHRKERKRRWSQMKGITRRQVPTPVHQALALKAFGPEPGAASDSAGCAGGSLASGDSGAAAAAAEQQAAEAFGFVDFTTGTEGFVLHRRKEDMEDD
mmetsp:Transcript_149301/g.388405  ORF Transcript_149301/g.388405 Transcript_149301/m.388405 type:complete len:448 (+) Transcript_149301:125-1468(+)|eukprot:CAMPEP_0115174962 /NCGR_PEP_ID=MMETSP0270-20121206/4111_1 /TAXON_ID=71861 /ORGANISM="Scrippsiella trochoidea, Strain CCMP3099" /LENGTH=447 /DNA_ID=CAMNT_0002587821 /DNA_START=46 /DNA_END=1389 /DNA_ORIENTATION=-